MAGLLSQGGAASVARGDAGRPDARTPARCRTGVRLLPTTRSGSHSRRRSPTRWCSNYYCRSLHITSFRSQSDRTRSCGGAQASNSATPLLSRPAPSCLQRGVEHRVVAGLRRRSSTTTSGRDPRAVDPGLVRRQPLRDRQPEPAAVALELGPLLDRALAERLACRRASRGRDPAAHRPRSPMPTPTRRPPAPPARIAGVHRRAAGLGHRLDERPVRVLLPEDRAAARNWLAMSRAAVTNPPGLPRRSRISFLRPASTSSATALSSCSAAWSEKPDSRM